MSSYKYTKASVSLGGLGTQPAVTYLVEGGMYRAKTLVSGAASSLPVVEHIESSDRETPAAALADLQRLVFAALQSH